MATVCLAPGLGTGGQGQGRTSEETPEDVTMSILESSRGDKTMNGNKMDRAIKAERGEASARSGIVRKG